ncbi:MAG: RNA 3'-terminal phosphate cyclase [Candidatus Methylomirabilota bacterium]
MPNTGVSILRVDGAQGEGGGQVLRTALALSAIRGMPVEIHSIRARRKNPGLQAQHLTAVSALAQICGAAVDGAALGSRELRFAPGAIQGGEYHFDVGTAGSTALVLQAILLPLALAPGPSRAVLTGGTHVPWSPSVHYVREVWFPVLGKMGVSADLELLRWGFYPKGGGRVRVAIEGGARLRPATLVSRQGAVRLRGLSVVANLARGIAERQRDQALRRLEGEGRQADIALVEAEAAGAGSFLILVADAGGVPAGFSAVGERGKPAERVADEVVDPLFGFLKGDAACDPYLADQVILPMALAGGTSRLTTSRVTPHLLTTVQIVQQALGCPVEVGGEEGSPGHVTIEGVGSSAESRAPRGEGRAVSAEGHGAWARIGDSAFRVPPGCPQSEIPSGAVVRKARATDVPAMQTLVAHFAARGELLPRTLNEMYQHLRDFFVAEVDGEIVGVCGLSLYWEDLAEIRTLAVHEAHAGKGLGSALVTACLEEAGALGVGRVFALTYRPGYFERFGFRTIDKRELPQKIWKDCIKCAKFACCDETALIRETGNVRREK